MKINSYFVAGLDFIFDKVGNPWFIEANYAPVGYRHIQRLYGKDLLIDSVAKMLKKEGTDIAVITREKTMPLTENSQWFYKKFKKQIPTTRLCYSEKNKNSRKYLVDDKGERFKPDAIFRYEQQLNSSFEKDKVVINPNLVQKVVNNKMLTLKILQDTNVLTPKTWYVNKKSQVKNIIKNNPTCFKDGYVLKPNDLTEGIDVHCLTKEKKVPKIKKYELLEQRIIPPKMHNHFWDVRIFVVNGKYLCGEIRESKGPVTNITLGGKPTKVPDKIFRKLKKPSLEAVKAIDEYVSDRL